MNRDLFEGFNDLKPDRSLVLKTQRKMQEGLHQEKMSFPGRKSPFIIVPFAAIVLVLSMVVLVLPLNKDSVLIVNAQDLMSGIKPKSVDVSNTMSDKFIKSTQHFSTELFKSSAVKGQNSLVSPASVYLALGMTANGADGETLNAFRSVLGKYNLTLDELNRAYKAYAQKLTQNQSNTTLNVSNSIWFKNDFNPYKPFLQSNADFYGASARKLNPKDQIAVDTINNWVRQSTNNKIDQIVSDIKPNDVMYLLNALYFNAKWQKPFDTTHQASLSDFYLGNGSIQSTKFMWLDDTVDYIKDQNASAVVLPYDDGHFAFLAILPDKGIKLDDYITTINENTMPNLMSKKTSAKIAVGMPEFKTSSTGDLKNILQGMGLSVAFEPGKADFSKMGSASEDLYISAIQSKTYLQVNELGTEAGAATNVRITRKGISQSIVFNRPFIYAVIDTQTNLPLFLGTMENPQS
jgi:serine protease inhibitor